MSQKGGDRAMNAVQVQAKQAVARYLRSQWQSIRKDRNELPGRLDEFIARKQIVLHQLAGVRLFMLHLWGYYALSSESMNRIVSSIDRTTKRIKLLKPRRAQQLYQEQKPSLWVVGG